MSSIASMTRIVLVALALLVAVPQVASAATTGTIAGTSTVSTSPCAALGGTGGFAPMRKAELRIGATMAGWLVGYGETMLRAFLLVALAWYGVTMMLGVGGSLNEPQALMMKVFFWGLVFMLFQYYGLIYQEVSGAMDALGNVAMGEGGGKGDAMCLLVNTGVQMFHNPIPHSSFSIYSIFNSAAWGTFWSMVGIYTIRWLVFALLILAAICYAVWFFIATIYLALAFGLGPVFLPMMMFRFTRELAFDGWLGFAWTALLYQLVGPAVLGLETVIITAALSGGTNAGLHLYTTTNGHISLNLADALYLIMTAATCVWISFRIPEVVRQLAAGAFHAGSLPYSPMQAISRMGSS